MGFLSDSGYVLPDETPSGAATPPVAATSSFLSSHGYSLPQTTAEKSAKQFSDEIPIPVPGQPGYDHAKINSLEDRLAEIASPSFGPAHLAKVAGANWWEATKAAAKSGLETYSSGLGDISRGMTARGVGNIGLGTLGVIGSPVSGALKALVGDPVTQLTGSPEIGSRAETVAGLAVPVKGAPATVKAATQDRAISQIVKTVGPENVPALVAEVQANPRLTLMDKSEPLRVMAQGLIDPAQPGAQTAITQNIKARIATAPAATNSAFTQAMGPSPNVPAMLEGLKQMAQDVGSKMIQPAIANAKPVDITPVIASLDKTIGPYALKSLQAGETPKLPMTAAQSKAWELRQRIRGDLPDRDTMFMDAAQAHEIQSQMRYEGSQLASSAAGSERLLSSQIMGTRNQLVNAIDKATNGAYKSSLSQYRDTMMVQEAFEKGFDTLKNRSGTSGLEDRPDMFQRAIKESSPEELQARQLGTRLDIDQKINGVKNAALAGQNVVAPEYNKEKLRMLFGNAEANRLIKHMEDSATEAQTNAKILQQSKTAETLAGQKALEVRKLGGGNVLNYLGAPGLAAAGSYLGGAEGGLIGGAVYGLARGAQYGTQLGLRSLERSRNLAFAKAVSATAGPERDQAITALMSHPAVVRASQKLGNALTTP